MNRDYTSRSTTLYNSTHTFCTPANPIYGHGHVGKTVRSCVLLFESVRLLHYMHKYIVRNILLKLMFAYAHQFHIILHTLYKQSKRFQIQSPAF